MRRALPIALLLVAAAGLAVVLLGDDEPSERPAVEANRIPGRSAPGWSPISPRLPVPNQLPGTVSGQVRQTGGTPAAGAQVCSEGPTPQCERTQSDGSFRLDDLAAGDYVLHASLGGLASEALGPIPLAWGEELRELILTLEAGGVLSGQVLDAADARPIPDATVGAGAARARTGSDGRFQLTGVPRGAVTLTASAEGYLPRSASLELSGSVRRGTDIHLERSARVKGTVTAGGRPVAGVEVLVARYQFAARLSDVSLLGVTDPEGGFAGEVRPGRLELVARGPGWAEARSAELDLAPGEERELQLALGAGGALLGFVRDAEGKGLSACRLQAFDSVHGRTVADGTSGPGGQYWLPAVPPAVYVVLASCSGGRVEAAGISVHEGAEVQVDLVLGALGLAGRVLDAGGGPVARATVSVRPEGSPAPPTPFATTQPDGTFAGEGLAPGRYLVTAAAQQGAGEAAANAGERGLVVVLGSGELLGVVSDSRGEPISDFTVYAEPAGLDGARPGSQRFLAPTGAFRLVLSPGRYVLRIGAPGYVPGQVPSVQVVAGAAPSSVRVTLEKGGTVRGRTVDEKGAPLAGVHVATHPNMLWAFGKVAPVPGGSFGISGPGGEFSLTGVKPGGVPLFARREGYRQKGIPRVDAASSGEASVTVHLEPDSRTANEQDFAGVGMTLGQKEGAIVIADVFPGGPAREAGLRPGDLILSVDGRAVAGLPVADVVGMIRGVVGTPVHLVVRRDGGEYALAIARAFVRF